MPRLARALLRAWSRRRRGAARSAAPRPRATASAASSSRSFRSTERQEWTPLGPWRPARRSRSGRTTGGAPTQMQIGPRLHEPGHGRRRRRRRRRVRAASRTNIDAAALGRDAQDGRRHARASMSQCVRADASCRRATTCACSATSSSSSIRKRPARRHGGASRSRRDAGWRAACSRCPAGSTPTPFRDVWRDALRALRRAPDAPVVVDAAGVDYCDGAGIALLVDLLRQRAPGAVEVANLEPAFEALLRQFDPARCSTTTSIRSRSGGRRSRRSARIAAGVVPRPARRRSTFVGAGDRGARRRRPPSRRRSAGATCG